MTLSDTSPYIEFKEVKVEYPGWVTGLHDVSLRIGKGDFVFFVGPTGAGKSTLIKLITREVRPTHGSVLLQGRDIGRMREGEVPSLRREMGIVPQDFGLLPRKRVWENVAYAMRAVGHTRQEVRRKVPDILEQVNIGHRADAYPHQLSGGEQQRVAIARALINNPPLLVADEPTGNLDPDRSWEIMELLKSLNLKGTTILVASHDVMVIHRMDKRIVTLEEGRVKADTAPVKAAPSAVFVSSPVNPVPSEIEMAIPPDSVEEQPSLSESVQEPEPNPDPTSTSTVKTESPETGAIETESTVQAPAEPLAAADPEPPSEGDEVKRDV
jgi:cell division transport system ATP-binding protein